MSTHSAAMVEVPAVPLTLEGYAVLHQMMRIRWFSWNALRPTLRTEIVQEAAASISELEARQSGQSAFYSLLGHKGDLMFVHFRDSFDDLNQVELQLSQL